ncbi:MAG TPA: chemotaxis protein CheW [Streptosporangiaceae bacterium]|nr:chemotaxis protein CheW [Streptosporangiaceae bacterium]
MNTYVQVRVAGEVYAIPVRNVVAVAPPGAVTRVPGTRPELVGVRNMRGAILPVFDLAAMLSLPCTAPPGRVLVTETGGCQAGFQVDEVDAVRPLGEPDADAESPLLAGALLTDGELIGFIDIPQLFGTLARSAS